MSIILDGKILSKKIEEEIRIKTEELKQITNKVPTLATIIVGDDLASITYVKMKQNACKRVGFNSIKIELDKNTTTEELILVIEKLNDDESINGILLQHPVPPHIDETRCFDKIKLEKDVDGVNSANFGAISMGKEAFLSATPLGIKNIIEHYQINVEGKNALVIGRSAILGKPVAMMLLNKNATVTIAHSKTVNLPKICKKADIVVACVGKPKFVKNRWLKKGVVIIDAGYNEGNIGDVDLEKCKKKASAYTPVPGGVGPMTIASLLFQTLQSFKKTFNL